MSKRKRANKKIVEEIKIKKLAPMVSGEELYFKDLVDTSSAYSKVLQQKAQYVFAIKKLQENRKKIQDGDITPPYIMTLIPNVLAYTISDKKQVLKLFDDQIKSYQTNLKSLTSQADHRYEDYVESATRNRDFWLRRFGDIKTATITADRRSSEKDEETLFEAEFKDMMSDPKKKAEFDKATKEAVKRNTVRKTKVSK